MIPPAGFKLDKATVDYLLADMRAYQDHQVARGYDDDVQGGIDRIETAVRQWGTTP